MAAAGNSTRGEEEGEGKLLVEVADHELVQDAPLRVKQVVGLQLATGVHPQLLPWLRVGQSGHQVTSQLLFRLLLLLLSFFLVLDYS